VFDDADLDAAVTGAMASKYRNTGQTCVCANRLLVQAGVYDAFVEKLVAATQKLRVGAGLEGPTEQGPLIDVKAVAKVEDHIADAVSKGARIALGGKRHALGGTFFEPTILTGVTTDMKVARERRSGRLRPCFSLKPKPTRSAWPMTRSLDWPRVYTRDLARSWRVSEALEYGIVGLNTGIISTEEAPFGGWKESGIGRGAHGTASWTTRSSSISASVA
jgi:succinate-semialdehyde dehydrogenase/glutarate-semialdehyde dehydrogenase